jgi:hypothetical protein
MTATVPYFKVTSNKCTVVTTCSIRHTFPRALPIDNHVIKIGGRLCFVDVLPFHIYYQMSCQRRVTVNLVIILSDQGNVDNLRTDCRIWKNVHTNRQQSLKTKRRLFSPENLFITIKEEISEMLYLERSFERYWNLDTSGSSWRKYLGGFEMWCWRRLETIS